LLFRAARFLNTVEAMPQVPPGQPPSDAPPHRGGGPPQAGGYGGSPQGYGGQQYGSAPDGRAPAVRMIGSLYITLFLLSTLALYGLVGFGGNPAIREAAAALYLLITVASIAMMVFLYKMWSAINDGAANPTPGTAIGFLFIPFFSIYWTFIVWPGYAKQYNAYIERHGIRAAPLSRGFILGTILLGWVPIVGPVLTCISLSRIAAAVNALSDANLPASRAF
jgi:hypothetical protein